jgi:hypothetical protein
MANSRARRIAAVAAGTVVLAGGAGVAMAANGGNPPASNFFDSVAKHLGVSPQKLQDATKAAAIDQVNQALAAGRITKDQADAMKKRIESGDVPPLGGFGGRAFAPGTGGPGPGFGLGAGPGMVKPFIEDGLSAAAKYLGLSENALRTQLSNGKSLADVAKAQNKDVKGLEDALVAAQQKQLDKLVTAKKLTQSQADALLSRLKSHVDDLVNANPPAAPRFREARPSGPRFFF